MQLDSIKVRSLSDEEVEALTPADEIYVTDRGWNADILIPAHADQAGGYYLKNKSLQVKTIYGSMFWAKFGKVFVFDEDGDEFPLIRTAGARMSGALYFPGVPEAEIAERLGRALRAEFPDGFEVWNLKIGPVKDVQWDVWEVKTGWVPFPGVRKNAKGPTGEFKEIERRLVKRGIMDAHQQYFRVTATPGWQIQFEPHQPETYKGDLSL